MVATHFFGKHYKNRGFWEFWKPDFLKKNGGTTSCPFSRPPPKWMLLFLGLFFSLFLLHLARGCSKHPVFIGFFLHTLLKHLVTSCSNKEVKPKLPKKGAQFFFGNLFFWPKTTFKNTNFAPPLKTVHKKSPKPLIFIGSKKVAKLLTLPWPSYWP